MGACNVLCRLGDEEARSRTLERYRITDTAPEKRFDTIVRLAGDMFHAPIAFVSLLETDRQWFKARVGWALEETSRDISFCTHTIRSDDVFVILDTHADSRFTDNPLVIGGPRLRFYAGAPLVTPEGYRIGALCIAGTERRQRFTKRERGLLKELAALVMTQLELRRSELQRATMMGFAEATELAMLTVDKDGTISFVNAAALKIFNYTREEMIGQPASLIVPERLRAAHNAGLARVVAGGASTLAGRTVEVAACRKDGTEFPIELSISLWHGEDGPGLGALIRDISERRSRDARLLRLAHQDALTGLCNRRRFEAILREAYERREPATVFLLDLDGFKVVNDTLGHAAGDAVLQAVAVRLPSVLSGDAIVARFGGDEFGALMPGSADPLGARASAEALLSAFDASFDLGGHVVRLGASVGFALAPDHGHDAEEVIASADFALYRAKKAGKRCVRLFLPEMRHTALNQRVIQEELFHALQRDELILHYQPQVSLQTGKILGVEALLRWQHPERGLVLPGAFLSAIKTSALTLPIGAWVIDEACRQMARWQAAGLPPLRVGVNLFSAQFRASTVMRDVTSALSRHGIEARMLELEITERIALQSDDRAVLTLSALREAGVGIAFDDFGTGYASLSWLKQFPLTTLKIDRSFVGDLLTDANDAAITRGIVAMSNELGLNTIAEGVETAEQEAALRALGCREGQGYRYGKAMPANSLADLLQEAAPLEVLRRRA